MTDQTNSLHDDISFLKNLAERGRQGPVLGGAFLAAAGLIFGAACAVQWAMEVHLLPVARWPSTGLYLWFGAWVLFGIVWGILFRQVRRTAAGVAASSSYAFSIAWTGCALGIAVSTASLATIGAVTHDWAFMSICPPLTATFYGTAWFISGAMARKRWMFGAAFVAFVLALVLAALNGDPRQVLALGVGLIVTLFVPGLRLIREARG